MNSPLHEALFFRAQSAKKLTFWLFGFQPARITETESIFQPVGLSPCDPGCLKAGNKVKKT